MKTSGKNKPSKKPSKATAGTNSNSKNSFRRLIGKTWSLLKSKVSKINPSAQLQIQDQQHLSTPTEGKNNSIMRPITKTDSSSTLIDINEVNDNYNYGKGAHLANASLSHSDTFVDTIQQTDIYLDETTTLSLPASPKTSLHRSLCSNPLLIQNAAAALEHQTVHTYTQQNAGKGVDVIYVHQREVGLVSTEQYSQRGAVLVSDAATTCHVFALRSITSNSRILGSLCHIDSTENEPCIRNMVQEHVDYHFNEETNYGEGSTEKLIMEVHVAGGYKDSKGTSKDITNFLMKLLRKIASETYFFMKVQIKTCLVSGLNDVAGVHQDIASDLSTISSTKRGSSRSEPRSSPIIRGMAMDVKTGEVSLIQRVHPSLIGPQAVLRRARLWSSSQGTHHLLPVHNHREEEITIDAFSFRAFEGIDTIMSLPDQVMLECCSTSPECEGPDFCELIRETCKYLLDYGVDDVFGVEMRSLVYKHKACSEWA
jgi:hypothetical protein